MTQVSALQAANAMAAFAAALSGRPAPRPLKALTDDPKPVSTRGGFGATGALFRPVRAAKPVAKVSKRAKRRARAQAKNRKAHQ